MVKKFRRVYDRMDGILDRIENRDIEPGNAMAGAIAGSAQVNALRGELTVRMTADNLSG